VIEILKIARTLSSVQRYSHTRLLNPESVLEHSGFVGLICYSICEKLNSAGEDFDTGIAVTKSIVHDIDETITGDIPRPTKYYSSDITKSLKKLAGDAVTSLSRKTDLPGLVGDWEFSKHGKEGAVVALVDIIAVVNKVWQETVEFGNHSLSGVVGPTSDILSRRLDELDKFLDGAGRDVLMEIANDLDVMLQEVQNERG
jgi:5'-deoxynucleotidase